MFTRRQARVVYSWAHARLKFQITTFNISLDSNLETTHFSFLKENLGTSLELAACLHLEAFIFENRQQCRAQGANCASLTIETMLEG